ncbi:hypothetical protein D3C87_2175730 [compost metagenome]
MITVITGRHFAAEAFHRREHAALELVIIIGVEQVVFTIVLVLQHRLHLAQTLGELISGRGAFV